MKSEAGFIGGSSEKQHAFGMELRALINRFSLENDSDTPDIVLTCYLLDCLKTFNNSVNSRRNLTHNMPLPPPCEIDGGEK